VRPALLLILFNRPDLTFGLFDILRAQPERRIYIAADGPLLGNEEDKTLCSEVQALAQKFADQYDGEVLIQI
jgi:hypothetical protein